MKLLKILPLIACLGFVGCSKAPSSEEAGAEKAETTTTETVTKKETETVAQKEYVSPLPDTAPTYKVATSGMQPPFTFRGDKGLLQGIDIDAMRKIGEEAGFKVQFYQEEWKNIFTSIEEGERNLAMSSISYSDARAKKYNLSHSYLFVPPAIVYRKTDTKHPTKLSDLNGLKIGALDGSIQIEDVKAGAKDVTIVPAKTLYLAYTQLIRGESDVILGDMQELQYRGKEFADYNFGVAPYRTEEEPSAHFVVLMNKKDTELLEKVNTAIDKLKAEGEFKKIEQKWIGK